MKNILFLALFGLLFVNSTLHAQKDPELKKPGMKLQPTYVHAHDGGKPIPAELILEIQRTGNKSYAPLPALQWATEYRFMTVMGTFEEKFYKIDPEKYLGPKVGWHDKINNPDNGFLVHNKLGPGRKIWTYGWLPQDFTAPDETVFQSGWYFFERNLYVVGEKGYIENEGTIDLDMGKIFYDVPEMQGVYIAWYADGCANPSLPTEVPFISQETVSNDPQPRRKGYVDPFYGSNWNVSVQVQQSYGMMMQPAPQYFSYGNMGWGQGYGYNYCPYFMPMPMLNNCFNCGGYGGSTTTTTNNYYNNNYHYGGNTINEGDNIVINEGDNIIIFPPPPVVDNPTPPTPPDDGGPVDPPNGENPGPNDDGGPVDPPNGEGFVNNGRNGSNSNGNSGNNNGGPSDAGNGMRTQNSENSIVRQVSRAGSNRETTSFSEIDSRVNAADKSWNSQKDALVAQREQRIQSDNSSRSSSTPSTGGFQRETQQSSLRSNTSGREFNSPNGTSSNSQVSGIGRNNPISQKPQGSVRELNRSQTTSANTTGRVQGNSNTSATNRVTPSPSTSTSSTAGRNTGGTTSTTGRVPDLTQSRVSSSNRGVSSSQNSSTTGKQVPVMNNNVSTGRSQTVQTTPSGNTGRMLPSPQVQNGGRQFNSTPSVPPASRMSVPTQQPSFRGGGMGMPSTRMGGGGRR